MSKGGSIAEQHKKVDAEIDQLAKEYMELEIPGPKQIYRMNNDEFMHHIHVMALTNILKAKFGVTQEEVELEMKKLFLEEGRKLLGIAKEERSKAIARQLTKGIILPNDPQI